MKDANIDIKDMRAAPSYPCGQRLRSNLGINKLQLKRTQDPYFVLPIRVCPFGTEFPEQTYGSLAELTSLSSDTAYKLLHQSCHCPNWGRSLEKYLTLWS